jgi:hypothetical protein
MLVYGNSRKAGSEQRKAGEQPVLMFDPLEKR